MQRTNKPAFRTVSSIRALAVAATAGLSKQIHCVLAPMAVCMRPATIPLIMPKDELAVRENAVSTPISILIDLNLLPVQEALPSPFKLLILPSMPIVTKIDRR